MELNEFKIGMEFTTNDANMFRCTDIGTRTVAAIALTETIESTHVESDGHVETIIRATEPLDFVGPPYKVIEVVFDEYDLPICEETPKQL